MIMWHSSNATEEQLLYSAFTDNQLCQNLNSEVLVLFNTQRKLLFVLSFTLKHKSKSQEICSCSNLSALTWALKLNNHIPHHTELVVSRFRGNELLFYNYHRDTSQLLNHQNHTLAHHFSSEVFPTQLHDWQHLPSFYVKNKSVRGHATYHQTR